MKEPLFIGQYLVTGAFGRIKITDVFQSSTTKRYAYEIELQDDGTKFVTDLDSFAINEDED